MVCAICGDEDESYSAYCGRCGRVPHMLIEVPEANPMKPYYGIRGPMGRRTG